MDPEVTHATMISPGNDLDERAVAATDLLCHMAGNGTMFVYVGRRSQSTWRIADECRYRVFAALDRLATLESFVAGIAALTKDGEGDVIENDDIYDTVMSLISEARELEEA